jgi:competence protein ComEA
MTHQRGRFLMGMLLAGMLLRALPVAFAEDQVVNINTASAEQLADTKGISAAKARAIVDYREKNGPFKSVDDLRHVKGIGARVLERLRPQVTVDTTAAAAAQAAAAAKH